MNLGASLDIRFDRSIPEFLDWITDRGLTHVELRQDYLETHPETPPPERISDHADEWDCTLSYHAAYRDCNIANPNEALRRGAVQSILETIDDATAAGAQAVTVHGGTLYDRYPERVNERSENAAVKSLRTCARAADDAGITLCLENQRDKQGTQRLTATPDRLASLLSAVEAAAPRPAVTLDVGHANVMGISPDRFIDRFDGEIRVVHLHTNDGTADDHDPLSNFEPLAERTGAQCGVLEMKSLADIDRCLDPS